MTEVDRQIARSNELLHRTRERAVTRRGSGRALRAVKYASGGVLAVLLGAFILGLAIPLGITGAMIVALLALAAAVFGVMLSREPEPRVEDLRSFDMKRLAGGTGRWLDSQRPMLPAPAQRLADGIGVKLDRLQPQLSRLDEKEPAAFEIRRLIADELPELVRGYERVPAHLRRDGQNGMSPDKQLIEGLAVVDSELDRISTQLAAGDLNALATQGRYLELKYQGDPE